MPDTDNKTVKTAGEVTPKTPAPKPSIMDAVLVSIAREENFLGSGDEASVYRLEGHDDWVVRVTDADAVAGTTMLTEAYDIYEGRNLGQEIYRGAGFTINRKQAGEGPQRIIQRMYETNKARGEQFPDSKALLDYWQKLADLPEAQYADLILDMNVATKARRAIDPNKCNYVIDFSQDPPKLGWVDIGKRGDHKSPNTVESVHYSILGSTLANLKAFKEMDAEWALESAAQRGDEYAQELMAQIDNAKKAITEKIYKVGADLGAPATYREIEAYEHSIGAKETVLYDEHSRQLTPEALYRAVHTMNDFPLTYTKDRDLTQAEKDALIAEGYDAASVENGTKSIINKVEVVDALDAIKEIRKLPSTPVKDGAVAREAAGTTSTVVEPLPVSTPAATPAPTPTTATGVTEAPSPTPTVATTDVPPVVVAAGGSVASHSEHATALHNDGGITVPPRGGFRALSGGHIDAHGGGSVSLAMGVIGLNAKLAKGSEFSNDLEVGGKQAAYSKASLTSDVASVVVGGVEWVGKTKLNKLSGKVASQTLDELDDFAAIAKLGKYSKWVKGAGVVGMAANVISTGFDVAAANEAGDGHRAARATGSLVGGLAGGAAAGAGVAAAAATIATFTAAGTVVPVLGNAVGAVAGLVVVGVGAWGGSELGGMAGEAVAGDDWQAHYDDQAKQQMAGVQRVLKGAAEKINRNQAKADAYETAANGMYGAIKGQNIAAIQTSQKKYDRSLEVLGTIEKFSDTEKKDFLASRQLLEKQLGYQLKHTQPNEKLITQLQTSLAVMDNAWLQINNYDVDFVATNKGQTLNIEGIAKNDAPKMRTLAAQRGPEILYENALFKQQSMAKKWNQLQDEKNQPLIQSLAGAAHIATQLTDKLQSHTLSSADVEQARALLAQSDPLRVQELANVEAYAAKVEKLKLQHEAQVKNDKAYAALAKKAPFPFDVALEQLHALEQQLKTPVPENVQAVLTAATQSLAAEPVSQEKALMQLIEQNPAFSDPALKARVVQQAAQLVSYYTQGTDAAGKDVSNGMVTLKDGVLDAKEMQAALATINASFKDKGVALSSADAAAILPAGSQAPKQRS